MIAINDSLDHVDLDMRKLCGERLRAYETAYATLARKHPVFCKGWGRPVMHPHRFMNMVVALDYGPGCDWTWIDVGAYDGALVMMLRCMGVAAYGIEAVDWKEMWDLLGVTDYMNKSIARKVHTISVLNYAHAFQPEELIEHLFTQYGEPTVLLIDREKRTPHVNNKLWYNENTLSDLGFSEIRSFPEMAATDINYGRELLVRRSAR